MLGRFDLALKERAESKKGERRKGWDGSEKKEGIRTLNRTEPSRRRNSFCSSFSHVALGDIFF